MKNKVLSVLLAGMIFFSLLPSIPAQAADATEETILQVLSILEIMNGDQNGNLNLSSSVTRAQFVKLAVSASIYKDGGTSAAHFSPFPDVRSDHWASGFVKTAVDLKLINGYLDGTFHPDETVLLEEAVTVILKLLGYTDADFTGVYPSGQLSLYRSLKLNKNITAAQGTALTRRQCAHLIYNALIAKTKDGTIYATTLGYGLDASGNVDYLKLVNTEMDGPVVMQPGSSIQQHIGFAPRMVYRDGAESSISAIQNYDVVYYLEKISTVWVSSKKVYGVYESATPNLASPTAITISGNPNPYAIGTSDAALALSAIGEFKIGDNITLLLGLDGSIAAVVSTFNEEEVYSYGVVTQTGTKSFQSHDGGIYSSFYVKVVTTTGATYEYPVKNDKLEAGDLVSIEFSAQEPVVTKLSGKNGVISGKVNSTATHMGDYDFAANVEIMDLYASTPTFVQPDRLKNVTIGKENVLFSHFNGSGEIDKLILNDVTGDMHTYGVITDIEETSGMMMNTSFEYYTGGSTTKQTMVAGKVFKNIRVGPFVMKINTGKEDKRMGTSFTVDTAAALDQEIRLSGINELTAKGPSQSYTISSSVQVYVKESKEVYFASSVKHLMSNFDDYKIVAYMDKPENQGGRIRVIIATKQ